MDLLFVWLVFFQYRLSFFGENYLVVVVVVVVEGYDNGITPNPDVLCNRYIKFDKFLHHAVNTLGADAIATGHYARLESAPTGSGSGSGSGSGDGVPAASPRLLAGVDRNKDQSYFLSNVVGINLNRVIFPLGLLHKLQVRRIAKTSNIKMLVEIERECYKKNKKNF